MADLNSFANLILQIADLPHGPYRQPQYERMMMAALVLRRFDGLLSTTMLRVVGQLALQEAK